MNLRRFFIIFLACFFLLGPCEIADAFSAQAATVQAGARKKKKRKTRKTTSRNKKRRTSRKRRKSTPAPKPDPIAYDSLTLMLNDSLIASVASKENPGGLRVNNVKVDHKNKTLKLSLNENFTFLPVSNELITQFEQVVATSLPDSLAGYVPQFNVGQKAFSWYITVIDPLPEEYRKNIPFVREASPLNIADKGMQGDIIALWDSHGRYYKQGSWQWQRPLIFETVEDIYTMGYVLPYIAPMLEDAGAYVMLPRERDINPREVIVDNDVNESGNLYSQPYYKESNGTKHWRVGDGDGFIYDLKNFRDTENPFQVGTYRQAETVASRSSQSVAGWYADIPEDGEYAVYVSYKTLPESATDAHYTVNYSGGSKQFLVNQTMGGSTWIYLGTFPFEKGYSDVEPVVALSNYSQSGSGKIVTADAIKIGGGMGNIERSPRRSDIYFDSSAPLIDDIPSYPVVGESTEETDETDETEEIEESSEETIEEETTTEDDPDATEPEEQPEPAPLATGQSPRFSTSGLPRYLEGARYWLHWAGMPESVYSPYSGSDDYKDDYTSRGYWVNYLAGGSRVLPNREGLGIPVDLAMALHSDAGKRSDDTHIGTLGIYYSNNGARYADGTPRMNSRMLTDLLMRQITGDIRNSFEPSWTRRSMWDKSYFEARMPEVPTTLIELLSHQNFADMQYGLNPEFQFLVSRAIYKGMARFMAERKQRDLVIQPLPVHNFAINYLGKNKYRLFWSPTPDALEPTAMPDEYIIFERGEDEMSFHEIGRTSDNHFDVSVSDDEIHSFRIVAANKGGISFPSETLALRHAGNSHKPMLIINGFTRISAPAMMKEGNRAGFLSEDDFGVPYIRNITFAGHQMEFNRGAGEAFGRSAGNYVDLTIAGNTFDFVALHGQAIADNNLGFVSSSLGAVEDGSVNLNDYKLIDLILGKQKSTTTGTGRQGIKYPTFSAALQKQLTDFFNHGGDIIITGQYVASDLTSDSATAADRNFAETILGVQLIQSSEKSRSGHLVTIPTDMTPSPAQRNYSYSNTLNEKQYIVEQPDKIAPAYDIDGQVFMELSDTQDPVGILLQRNDSRRAILSVPFESFAPEQRTSLMTDLLKYVTR